MSNRMKKHLINWLNQSRKTNLLVAPILRMENGEIFHQEKLQAGEMKMAIIFSM
jgi:hypothetical protein